MGCLFQYLDFQIASELKSSNVTIFSVHIQVVSDERFFKPRMIVMSYNSDFSGMAETWALEEWARDILSCESTGVRHAGFLALMSCTFGQVALI